MKHQIIRSRSLALRFTGTLCVNCNPSILVGHKPHRFARDAEGMRPGITRGLLPLIVAYCTCLVKKLAMSMEVGENGGQHRVAGTQHSQS